MMQARRRALYEQIDELVDIQRQWLEVLNVALDDAVLSQDEQFAFVCFAIGRSAYFIGEGLEITREGARLVVRRAIAKVMSRIQGAKVDERALRLGDFGERVDHKLNRIRSAG